MQSSSAFRNNKLLRRLLDVIKEEEEEEGGYYGAGGMKAEEKSCVILEPLQQYYTDEMEESFPLDDMLRFYCCRCSSSASPFHHVAQGPVFPSTAHECSSSRFLPPRKVLC